VAAGGPLGSVQFHHLLSVGMQEPGQAGAVATGAFDRPHPPTVVSVGELQQLPVAGRGGRHGHLLEHGAANCLNDRGGVGVLVGVDPDDELDEVCQHSHALTPCPDVDVDGSVRTGRTAGL
jgi:hypothetical protein